MTEADYQEKIPNNVDLHEDRRLQRALESWQPNFLNWWESMGPTLPTEDVYLRTAVNVGREGWAHFGHVAMRDYRWGIFLAERDRDRQIGFGQHMGEPAWQQVPGEYRAELQRLIVIQGDTEPASVEQQRNLGATAPSLYDLRNLFQVNVEEGRHLWAMVYLLHAYFGRQGREEAEELLHRNSGSAEAPRILGAFNEETPDWLSFFMFTYFTDRRLPAGRGANHCGAAEVPAGPAQRGTSWLPTPGLPLEELASQLRRPLLSLLELAVVPKFGERLLPGWTPGRHGAATFKLGVELGAEQDGDIGDPHPDQEDDHALARLP